MINPISYGGGVFFTPPRVFLKYLKIGPGRRPGLNYQWVKFSFTSFLKILGQYHSSNGSYETFVIGDWRFPIYLYKSQKNVYGHIFVKNYSIDFKFGQNHNIDRENKSWSFCQNLTWLRHIMACDVILAPFSKFVALFPKICWRQQKCSLQQ